MNSSGRLDSGIEAAVGYLELGMAQAAWDALDELEPGERGNPDVLMLRVRIYLALGKIEAARIVAEGLTRFAPDAADAWLALARVEAAEGNTGLARKHLAMAFSLDLNVRLEALDDESLEAVWIGSIT